MLDQLVVNEGMLTLLADLRRAVNVLERRLNETSGSTTGARRSAPLQDAIIEAIQKNGLHPRPSGLTPTKIYHLIKSDIDHLFRSSGEHAPRKAIERACRELSQRDLNENVVRIARHPNARSR